MPDLDLDRRLDDAVRVAAASFTPSATLDTRVADAVRRRRRRRRVSAIAGGLGLAALAVAGVAVLADHEPGSQTIEFRGADVTTVPATTAPPAPPTTSSPSPPSTAEPADRARMTPGVETLDPGPLDIRHSVVPVVAGDVLVVWGGSLEGLNFGFPELGFRSYTDGAVYDLTTGAWRPMADGPLGPAGQDVPETGVWTGEEVIRTRGAWMAAYDPATDAWRELAAAPASITQLVWTGSELVALGANARYDMATDTWTPIPPPPITSPDVSAVWTGSEIVLAAPPSLATRTLHAVAFDPATSTWRDLPEVDLGEDEQAIGMVWTGEEVVVVGYGMSGAAYAPASDTWRRLPDLPVRFFEGVPRLFSVDGTVVAFRAPGIAILADDGWVVVPWRSDLGYVYGAVADGGIYSFGLNTASRTNAFVRFDTDVALTEPLQIQLGLAVLDLAPDEQLPGMALVRDDEGFGSSVVATIETPDGVCKVNTERGGSKREPGVTPRDDGTLEVVLDAPVDEVIVVGCPDPGRAGAIAERVALSTPWP